MKQAHNFAAAAVDGGDIASFTPVTQDTGVSQVFHRGKAAMLAAEDVIDMRPECNIVFVDQAVFATMMRATGDLAAKRLVNVTAHRQESGALALWPSAGCVPTP